MASFGQLVLGETFLYKRGISSASCSQLFKVLWTDPRYRAVGGTHLEWRRLSV